jgi:hypothetical protein
MLARPKLIYVERDKPDVALALRVLSWRPGLLVLLPLAEANPCD